MIAVFKRALVGFGVMTAVFVFTVVFWIATSLYQPTGDIRVRGLEKQTEIIVDRYGVPHIFAETVADAYFALGYAHARDRLWQMEMTRRLGAGRLSEIFGQTTVDIDRLMRIHGIYADAKHSFDTLSPEFQSLLLSYARGVNSWIGSRRLSLAPEFSLFLHRPEPWQPADSLVWTKLMGLRLSKNMRTELLRANLLDRLSSEQIKDLWPLPQDYRPTILNSGTPPGTPPGDHRDFRIQAWNRQIDSQRMADLKDSVFGPVSSASNAWVLSGAHSATGKPLLANDPHLRFTAPSQWYLARIVTPKLTAVGATAPGTPVTIFGHNGRVAWGMTSAEVDVEDLFVERLSTAQPDHYDTPNGPEPFEVKEEIIRVRGGDPVTAKVRQSRHGVIISDHYGLPTEVGDTHVLALATTVAGDTDHTLEAVFDLNRTADWAQFRAAAAKVKAPALNIMYADTSGNIGYSLAGDIPMRADGLGEIPRPGWTGSHDWRGSIPWQEVPWAYNPPSGMIIAANNKIIDTGYPHLLALDWPPPYRAQRLQFLLGLTDVHSTSVESLIQHDVQSVMAADLLPLMTDFETDNARLKQTVGVLREWDGRMLARRAEPLIFMTWLRFLARNILADELGPYMDEFHPFPVLAIKHILQERRQWCDNVMTTNIKESCGDQLEQALRDATRLLAHDHGENPLRWRWKMEHSALFRHSLADENPVLNWLLSPQIEADGGNFTVNRGVATTNRDNRLELTHGPGLRVIYDLSDLSRTRFMLAPGQSGNPLSGNYDLLLKDWRDGRYLSLGLQRETLRLHATRILRLEP